MSKRLFTGSTHYQRDQFLVSAGVVKCACGIVCTKPKPFDTVFQTPAGTDFVWPGVVCKGRNKRSSTAVITIAPALVKLPFFLAHVDFYYRAVFFLC